MREHVVLTITSEVSFLTTADTTCIGNFSINKYGSNFKLIVLYTTANCIPVLRFQIFLYYQEYFVALKELSVQ